MHYTPMTLFIPTIDSHRLAPPQRMAFTLAYPPREKVSRNRLEKKTVIRTKGLALSNQ